MLLPQLLELLRFWRREGKRRGVMLPQGWLFPGRSSLSRSLSPPLSLSRPFRRASSIGLSMRQPKPLASRSVSPAHVASRLCKLDIVFTVPAEIADIAFHNKAAVYDLLFRVASETMVTVAADLRLSVHPSASPPSFAPGAPR